MNTLNSQAARPTHVVVLGGGFGGLTTVRRLAGSQARITLVDRQNHHLFQPLLYQVATASLAAPSIAAPLRHIVRKQRNVTVLLDEVTGVDLARKQVQCGASTLDYDYLVVATVSHAQLFRSRRLGTICASAEDPRRRVADSPACAACV